MKSNCPCCDSTKIKLLFENHDRMFPNKEIFHICKCCVCDLIFVGEELTEKDLDKYYPDNYYTNNEKSSKKRLNKLTSLFERGNILSRFLLSKIFYASGNFLPIEMFGNGRVLDIGCGGGELLNRMKLLKWKTFGYDVDSKIEKQISKNHTFISKLDSSIGRFDLITATDVIEHVPDFKKMLININVLLDDFGLLLITTPTSSIFFNIFGKYWYPLDTPRHLYIFKKNNLINVLNETGFKVVKVKKINFFSYIFNSIDYSSHNRFPLFLRMVEKLRLTILLNGILYTFFSFLGLGETLVIYARKK